MARSPAKARNKDRDEFPLHDRVRENDQRKDNEHQMSQRQGIVRIKDEVERKTKIPKDLQHLVNQGKVPIEKKTIEEKQHKSSSNTRDDFETAGWNERRRNDDLRRKQWKKDK